MAYKYSSHFLGMTYFLVYLDMSRAMYCMVSLGDKNWFRYWMADTSCSLKMASRFRLSRFCFCKRTNKTYRNEISAQTD